MRKSPASRFAHRDGTGRLLALVADGLPEWPDDLTAVEDAALADMESAYLAEFERLAATDTAETDLQVFADRVRALRDEAAARMTAAGTGEPDPEPPAADPEPDLAADPEPTVEPDADRAARIDQMRAGMAPAVEPAADPDPGVTREDLVAAVGTAASAAASAAATAAVEAMTARQPAPEPAGSARVTAADLGARRPGTLAPTTAPARTRPRVEASLITSADIPNVPMGAEITSHEQLVEAFTHRLESIGQSSGVSDEKVPVATLRSRVPEGRDIRNLDWSQARKKVQAVVGPDAIGVDPFTGKEALVASGGLSAPVEPYYPQLVIAQSARPVRDALPTFMADRGGIKLVSPPSLGSITGIATTGSFADGVTNTDTTLSSATAVFTAADIGSYVAGSAFANGTRIVTITDSSHVVLSLATLVTGTGVSFNISGRNPNNLGAPVGLVTAAQDAAGPPNVVKYTFDVPNGTQAEFDVYSVYTSLQFANLTARTFPERVEAYIRLADALAARTAETALLDVMTNWSTLFTGAKTFGSARQLLAQLAHMAAFYRNSERMDPAAVLRVGVPAWAIDNMRADYLSTFIGGGAANWGLSDDEIAGFFVEHRLMPFLYQDGPTDISQLFVTTGISGATNTGTNTATPIAIPDYPGQGATSSFRTKVVSFMFAEGTWLYLSTGELNLGLVRDSILNSQNRFRNFEEVFETAAFVGQRTLRGVHTVAADGTYGAAASITLGAGSGI